MQHIPQGETPELELLPLTMPYAWHRSQRRTMT